MSTRAWSYISSVLAVGIGLSAWSLTAFPPSTADWTTFVVFVTLATLAQLYTARAPGHQSYHITLVFLLAGVLLLPLSLFVLLVVVPHVIEWGKERWVDSPRLRNWYLQPFNISTHVVAGFGARWAFTALHGDPALFVTFSSVLTVVTAAIVYVLVNHLLVGLAIVLARGVSLSESGILDAENLVTDLVLLLLGYIVAVLWKLNPWLIVPALSPLLLVQRALSIPQLKHEAQVDEKTGLWNARHFADLFKTEFERAKRFDRQLSLIMADLDLLRNINNTYGHLAGDEVLAGIGQIIRKTIREYDIAGRFGGEEFTIVLPEVGPSEAGATAERLRRAVENSSFQVKTSSAAIRATMSIGVASFPKDAATPTDLIHQADVAVYQAKLKGRNCVVGASDVPRSIRLADIPMQARLTAAFDDTNNPRSPRPCPMVGGNGSGASGADLRTETVRLGGAAVPRRSTQLLFPLALTGVVVAGLFVTALGFVASPHLDLTGIALLTMLALITQLPLVKNLYGESSMSVAVAINFATALINGIPGVAFASAAIVLVHYVQRRPRLYKTIYNWSTHVLAGAAPALAFRIVPVEFQLVNLPLLVLLVVVPCMVYYFVETALVNAAVNLSEPANPLTSWRERYGWLAPHFLVLSILGFFLGIAYMALGPAAVFVFALPVLMMAYAQKQYVERMSDNIHELERLNQELTAANRSVSTANTAIRQLNEELFMTLAKIIDARDPYVSGHSAKVADYSTAIARELHLPPARVEQLRQAAFLHDIGKIGIAEHILHKPGRLDNEEYARIQTHVTVGAQFLETFHGLRHLVPFVKYHHEHWDGKGYPSRLRKEGIPLEARILAVSDAVESMASDRPYRPAKTLKEIIAEIRRCAGTQFDPVVVEAFARVAEREGTHLVVNSAQEVVRKQNGDAVGVSTANGVFAFGP